MSRVLQDGEAVDMTNILILQDQPDPMEALRKSLEATNELYFVKGPNEAIAILEQGSVNLIIARVHLDSGNIFEFIRQVKENSRFKELPLICFCGKRTEVAKALCPNLSHATEVFGADKYICLDQFCVEGRCDFERLRNEIETVISGGAHDSH